MVRRLVLGCGTAGEVVLGVVSTWGRDLWAVVPDGDAADGIEGATTVVHGDPADPETYSATTRPTTSLPPVGRGRRSPTP